MWLRQLCLLEAETRQDAENVRLENRGRPTRHREWRVETLGFGIFGMLGLIVSFANLLIAPALVTAGTLLVLDHRQLPPNQAAGYGAGWQAHLDGLAGLDLAGWDARFAEFLPGYREQLAALG